VRSRPRSKQLFQICLKVLSKTEEIKVYSMYRPRVKPGTSSVVKNDLISIRYITIVSHLFILNHLPVLLQEIMNARSLGILMHASFTCLFCVFSFVSFFLL
jgi:hypothetical protein